MLSKERMGEISLAVLLEQFEREGLHVKPREILRDVANRAKKLGIPVGEMAEFTQTEFTQVAVRAVCDRAVEALNRPHIE